MAHTARWGTCEQCRANCLPADRFCTRCKIALDDAWAFGYSQTHGVSVLDQALAQIVTAETHSPIHRALAHARREHGYELIRLQGETVLRWRVADVLEPGTYATAVDALRILCPDTEAMVSA